MRKINRIEFLKLPEGTIYSKVNDESCETCYGLFRKCCNPTDGWGNDWLELELTPIVCFIKCPNNITNGGDIMDYGQDLADSGKDFEIDYTMIGRNGLYEDKEMFVIWDKNDKQKLIKQLSLLD